MRGSGGAAHAYGSGTGLTNAKTVAGSKSAELQLTKLAPPWRRATMESEDHSVAAIKKKRRSGICICSYNWTNNEGGERNGRVMTGSQKCACHTYVTKLRGGGRG